MDVTPRCYDLEGKGLKFLVKKIRYFLIQEAHSPMYWMDGFLEEGTEEWDRAWKTWEENMESVWKDLACTHACKPMSDEECKAEYGTWKDRKNAPEAGQDLQWVVGCVRRPGFGWMH